MSSGTKRTDEEVLRERIIEAQASSQDEEDPDTIADMRDLASTSGIELVGGRRNLCSRDCCK